MIIGIRTRFDAAHFLPKHEGKCRNLHGHSWVVEVEVDGEVYADSGMVVDFAILKKSVQQVVGDLYDHRLLNDVLEDPTAENLAAKIFNDLSWGLSEEPINIHKVKVYETPDCWVRR